MDNPEERKMEYILIDRVLVQTMSELLDLLSDSLEGGSLVAVNQRGRPQVLRTQSLRRASSGLREMMRRQITTADLIEKLQESIPKEGE